jgi:hypothetical protein
MTLRLIDPKSEILKKLNEFLAGEDFNKAFEEAVKKDKPEPSAIILHPEAMAYIDTNAEYNQ